MFSELLFLTEMIERKWRGIMVNGIIAGVQGIERAREGLATLLSDV